MQQLKNDTLKLLTLDQRLDNSVSNPELSFPIAIKTYIRKIFILLNLTKLENAVYKSRAVECTMLNSKFHTLFSNFIDKPSQNLIDHIREIIISVRWDRSNLEKTIYKNVFPEFTPFAKIHSICVGTLIILCRQLRKTVFSKDSRYKPIANEVIKMYAQSGIQQNPLLYFENFLNTDKDLLSQEARRAKEFFLDFPPLIENAIPHFNVEALQQIESTSPSIEINEEVIRKITKSVEEHLDPYLAGLRDTPPEQPLFQQLQKSFAVDRTQLLNIALRVYCRYAFRFVYFWQDPLFPKKAIPPIYYQKPENAISIQIDFTDDKRWFQTWTGTSAPEFSKHIFGYLRSLGPAVHKDFGFFAPHPKELVDIAIEEIKNFQKVERDEMAEIKHTYCIYTNFSTIFTRKITELLSNKCDLETPFEPALIEKAEINKTIFEWYKKSAQNENPPFNFPVLKAIYYTAQDVQNITVENPHFSFRKIKEMAANIITKQLLAIKFDKEKCFRGILAPKLQYLCANRIDLCSPFKGINDAHTKMLSEWYKTTFSTSENPLFNVTVLKAAHKAYLKTVNQYKAPTRFTKEDFNSYVKFVIYKVRMASRANLEKIFDTTLQNYTLPITHVYIKDLPSDEQTAHIISNQYEEYENWYKEWKGLDCPGYTLDMLSTLKYFSPLTEKLPKVWIEPEKLEKRILEHADNHFMI